MLQGYTVPLSPLGKAALTPDPPWHYAGHVLAVEFRANPIAVARLLPPGLSPDPGTPGHGTAFFIDWQFTAQEDEHLDPARYQFREASVLLHAMHGDRPVHWCPYAFVDNDAALAQGWVQGFPTKLGSVHQTRSYAAPGKAAVPLAAGSRFGASLSAHGERLMNARVTLRDVVPDASKLMTRPTVTRRYFPRLARAFPGRPLLDELTQPIVDDLTITDAWMGEAELAMPASNSEELSALAPRLVGLGFRYGVSFSVNDVRTLSSGAAR
jgi:hypothetical protein